MPDQSIDYGRLVERALRQVVRAALDVVAKQGLPGRHHLYITFRTDHPGVAIAEDLRARYPSEMTIVLQHEFWGLEVWDDRFAVTLSFNSVSQRLEVPFAAVTVFADPSVEFGLQFTRASAPAAEASSQSEAGARSAKPPSLATLPESEREPRLDGQEGAAPAPTDGAAEAEEHPMQDAGEAGGADKVVTLDRFRKK
jgi:uncharacterized protein